MAKALYQEDYYAWTRAQAAELRRMAAAHVNTRLDLENLAEEVESLGRSDLATVRSQLRRIIEHLLKLEHSPAAEPRLQWKQSVGQARDEVADRMTAALRREVAPELDTLFARGRRDAELGLLQYGEQEAAGSLPTACPYGFDEIVRHDWYPKSRHGLTDPTDTVEP
jgi:Domain of unknown function DUF29